MLESLYQSYEMTRTKQRASLVLPKGETAIVDKEYGEEDDRKGGTNSYSWKTYIYGNDVYRLSINYKADSISGWNGTCTMMYEDISTEYGVNVPYTVYRFTQQDLQYVASLLDSPVLLRQELEWPRNHILPGNIRYDAFARNMIYGYYKGMPICIALFDSDAAYPEDRPPYQYMPTVHITFLEIEEIEECINGNLANGYRRQ